MANAANNSPSNRERMSVVDNAWLRMDSPDNLMIITGVLIFEDKLEREKLVNLISEKFQAYPKFFQKVLPSRWGTYLEDCEEFEIENHIVSTHLQDPNSETELRELASALVSTPLNPEKPLWQIEHIEDFQQGSAIAIRLHHCYADGIALVSVMTALSDDSEIKLANIEENKQETKQTISPLRQSSALPLKNDLQKGVEKLWRFPSNLLNGLVMSGKLLLDATKVIFLNRDAHSTLKNSLTCEKQVAWAPALSLPEVKKVAKTLNCTVNDVLVACVAASIDTYLKNNDKDYVSGDLRATLPFNLRPLEKAHELGNKFGLIYLDLPTDIEDPVARVYESNRRMNQLKGTTQPLVSFLTLGALGFGPKELQRKALNFFTNKSSAVMTNVPGPKQPIYFAGAKLKKPMFWVPQSGHIGLGISIFSYNNQVEFGITADKNLIADPSLIIDQFQPEFEKIVQALKTRPVSEGIELV